MRSATVNDVTLAKLFWVAEHLGGRFYDGFCARVENQDIASVFTHFASHEHDHARWYGDWLTERGHSLPYGALYEAIALPGARLLLAPQSLDRKLRTFSATELAAAKHLTQLVDKIRDPELRSIVERTIPVEQMHAEWYEKEGRRMVRSGE